jgi:DNA replication protein DnaC
MKETAVGQCSACRNTGWILKESEGDQYAVPCPNCRANRRSQRLMETAGIPPRYLDRGFDVYSTPHKSQEKALLRAIQYVEQYPDVPRGLLLVGPCGVGKTHLSVAILKTLLLQKEVPGAFVDESELLRRLQYSYRQDSSETEKEVLYPLMNVDLLVWDDLGTGRPTEWVSETIRMVINHRYTYNKQTILSTNWPLRLNSARPGGVSAEQSLADRIGTRLFSRIMEMCEIVEISGPDARIEIHKARMDFEQSRRPSDSFSVPSGLLRCPTCTRGAIDQLGTSKTKHSKAGDFVELACFCRDCSDHFVARFFTKTGKLEYVNHA